MFNLLSVKKIASFILIFMIFMFGFSSSIFAINSNSSPNLNPNLNPNININVNGEILKAKLNAIQSMSADFKQVIKAEGKQLSNSSGFMILDRPGRLRWQTIKPSKQLMIADGKQIWIYDEDLEQVTIKKQTESIDGFIFFLSKEKDITKDFIVAERKDKNKVKITYDLRSKQNKSNFKRIKLTFERDYLKVIEIQDSLGQHTQIQLSNPKMNKKVAENSFRFDPPKGTDIIRE